MKNTMTKGEIRHELAKAKKELKDAWICGEGYEYDQNFIVCYKDGTVLETREANERLPQTGIIGIQFFGTDAHYTVGYEMYNGEKVLIEDESEDACYRVEYLPLTSTEATAETVESVEETTVSETETVEETAEQTAEPETFSYEFNEIHKITISKRNNVYVEEFFEKMGGSYVKLGEEAWGCIEDIEEYYGIKINRNVQTDTEESESESEPTAENITVSGTNQDNINVLIVADVINTFEMITHTGYFDTS